MGQERLGARRSRGVLPGGSMSHHLRGLRGKEGAGLRSTVLDEERARRLALVLGSCRKEEGD